MENQQKFEQQRINSQKENKNEQLEEFSISCKLKQQYSFFFTYLSK